MEKNNQLTSHYRLIGYCYNHISNTSNLKELLLFFLQSTQTHQTSPHFRLRAVKYWPPLWLGSCPSSCCCRGYEAPPEPPSVTRTEIQTQPVTSEILWIREPLYISLELAGVASLTRRPIRTSRAGCLIYICINVCVILLSDSSHLTQ